MKIKDFNKSILAATQIAEKLGVEPQCINPSSLPINWEFRDYALDLGVNYHELYKKGLELKHYNIILKDFSYFQYSIFFSGKRTFSIRHAFYPNPFPVAEPMIEAAPQEQSTEEWAMLQAGQESLRSGLFCLRYDYSKEQYVPLEHPCAHFHFGHLVSGRWAARRILSPLAFAQIVLRHVYPDRWFSILNADAAHFNEFDLEQACAKERLKLTKIDGAAYWGAQDEVFFVE